MRRSIPSLSALQSFEAAGRLQSFTHAADELFVTQGAISRQIRTLEDELGVKLFSRLTRKVELTEAGRLYLGEVQFALDHIERATSTFRAQRKSTILTISVLPSVGSFWIMRRLANFSQRHPEVETRMITSISPVDLHSGEVDVAIRVGRLPGKHYDRSQPRINLEMVTNWRGVRATQLCPDILVPLYSPKLLKGAEPIVRPEQLLDYPLVHTSSRRQAWPDWLLANGLSQRYEEAPIEYGHFFMALEAAREGQGLAIVPSILLVDADLSGLVRPFELGLASAGEYYLLALDDRSDESHIAAFCQWVTEQMDSPAWVGAKLER